MDAANLDTMPNKRKDILLIETHIIDISDLCPVSHNPQPKSTIVIQYIPNNVFLEVYSLTAFINSFKGGRVYKDVFVRDMEQVIQIVFDAVRTTLDTTHVKITATLKLDVHTMKLELGSLE